MWTILCNLIGKLTTYQWVVLDTCYPKQVKAYKKGIVSQRELVKFIKNKPI